MLNGTLHSYDEESCSASFENTLPGSLNLKTASDIPEQRVVSSLLDVFAFALGALSTLASVRVTERAATPSGGTVLEVLSTQSYTSCQ